MSNKQNLDELFGPAGKGEYNPGQQITFREGDTTLTGEVIHCSAPQTLPSSKQLPLTYEVDCADGFPHIVTQSQIVQR